MKTNLSHITTHNKCMFRTSEYGNIGFLFVLIAFHSKVLLWLRFCARSMCFSKVSAMSHHQNIGKTNNDGANPLGNK